MNKKIEGIQFFGLSEARKNFISKKNKKNTVIVDGDKIIITVKLHFYFYKII